MRELKVEKWRKLIYECRNSGQTIRTWCNEHNISPQTFYRWQRVVWDAGTQNLLEGSKRQPVMILDETAVFAEYPLSAPIQSAPASTAAVILHLDAVTLEIQNGVSSETVEAVLRAVKALC
ncbi:hypothetical protein Desaci_4272 [Desulfosporosinus acidiphilus SJ4]|uniref:Transposase n=1 Tax=Desulfosporosinus acidiphilus (strain DSM 22704 / JCM 16185 / SJ4) TaxID=646529 RepID=I4DBE9_DESAJ|nr:helix-turn-helix domain-containing protein [Desulfosporosinus acidiphilus]AFM43123.1 hypothetical protein Desaci_4272 [Desulfosporosinus acidiphilus SJ4]